MSERPKRSVKDKQKDKDNHADGRDTPGKQKESPKSTVLDTPTSIKSSQISSQILTLVAKKNQALITADTDDIDVPVVLPLKLIRQRLFNNINNYPFVKELDGNELLILQEKTKILKLTSQVLGGVQPIDSINAKHQTYRLSQIRDILSSFPPINQKDVVP